MLRISSWPKISTQIDCRATSRKRLKWCHGRSPISPNWWNRKNAPRGARSPRFTWCGNDCSENKNGEEMFDVKRYLEDVRRIATDAGQRILKVYESEFAVQSKDDRSPLTEADRQAHELIVARLAMLTPDIPVLSEESSA